MNEQYYTKKIIFYYTTRVYRGGGSIEPRINSELKTTQIGIWKNYQGLFSCFTILFIHDFPTFHNFHIFNFLISYSKI